MAACEDDSDTPASWENCLVGFRRHTSERTLKPSNVCYERTSNHYMKHPRWCNIQIHNVIHLKEHVFALASSVTRNLFEISTAVDKPTVDFEQAATMGDPDSVARRRRVARPPRAAESNGRQNEYFKNNNLLLRSINFKSLRQTKFINLSQFY